MIYFLLKLSLVALVVCSSTTTVKPSIVGGEDIDIKEAPYQVSVRFAGGHICGGSIIDKNIIITAAHCLKLGGTAKDYKVRVGTSYYKRGGDMYDVDRFIPNPNANHLDYDIGLIWLSTPIAFSNVAKAIEMDDKGFEVPIGGECVVTGWGYVKENSLVASPVLKRVRVPKVSDADCKTSYGETMITSRMLCAGIPKGGKDACQGDSGGPLVYNNKLSGIVSWGEGCAEPHFPGVYSKVSSMRDWIDENIAKLKKVMEKNCSGLL